MSIQNLKKWALYIPLINKARVKMASRDLVFKDALHVKLTDYISPLQATEYERFLDEKSEDLRNHQKVLNMLLK